MRVTVVVTGLGQPPATNPRSPEQRRVDGSIDYQKFERPTMMRKQATQNAKVNETTENVDYLDIPAFLRRQEKEEII